MFQYLVHKFPNLNLYLEQAQIRKKPEEYIRNTIILSTIFTIAIGISLTLFLLKFQKSLLLLLLLLPLPIILFYFFISSPKYQAKKRVNDIDSEVVYAGRYLLVEMSAGIPLFDALVNVSQAYPKIGRH